MIQYLFLRFVSVLSQFHSNHLSDLLTKKYGISSEDDILDKIDELIDSVNNAPFTDTWDSKSYCIDNLSDTEKPNRIQAMEKKYTPDERATDENYLILNMCSKYVSTFGQFWNNGYALTIFGESHLVTPYDKDTKKLIVGYIEMKMIEFSRCVPNP